MAEIIHPFTRIARLVKEEKSEVSTIYFYAILSGLIQLSLPLGIQAIIGFVMGGALSTSLVILITLVVIGVLSNGLLQMSQLKVIEAFNRKYFCIILLLLPNAFQSSICKKQMVIICQSWLTVFLRYRFCKKVFLKSCLIFLLQQCKFYWD
jgi:uncharacterized membrane protein (Fun14 family)